MVGNGCFHYWFIMFVSSRRYNYIRARQLEGTYPGDPKEGTWPITYNRTLFGWGEVSEEEWPYFRNNDFLDPEPPGLDKSAKRHRIRHYRRIRNSSEARTILERNERTSRSLSNGRRSPQSGWPPEVKVAFEITPEFLDARHGLIRLPSTNSPIIGAHAVPLVRYSRTQNWFEFINSWGYEWGDHGHGYMPIEFFDEWQIDCWAIDQTVARFPNAPGIHEIRWDAPEPLGAHLYTFEIYDRKEDERIGWSFATHRGEHLDIEEFYVRPLYRLQGYGSRLAEMVRHLSDEIGTPLRAWIPFADCEETNRPALARIISKLGLNLRRSGVRWAAYRAMPSKRRDIVFDPLDVPHRPAYVRSATLKALPASNSPVYPEGTASYEGPITEEAIDEIAAALFCALDAEEGADGQI
jgi:GNAT superfamily N-acetyltransferase